MKGCQDDEARQQGDCIKHGNVIPDYTFEYDANGNLRFKKDTHPDQLDDALRQPIDLARPKQNQKKTGFMPEERVWIDEMIADDYIDIFRDLNPDLEGAYSWWTMRAGARQRNVGWRLDYFFITPDLRQRATTAEIHADVMGSDHCPVSLTLRL